MPSCFPGTQVSHITTSQIRELPRSLREVKVPGLLAGALLLSSPCPSTEPSLPESTAGPDPAEVLHACNERVEGKGTVPRSLGEEAQKADITSSMALGPSWVVRVLSHIGDLRLGVNQYTVTAIPNGSLYSTTLTALSQSPKAASWPTGTQERYTG